MSLSKKERDDMRKAASCILCDANIPLAWHTLVDHTTQEVHRYQQAKHPEVDLGFVEVARLWDMGLQDASNVYLVCQADKGRLACLDALDAKDKEIEALKEKISEFIYGEDHGESYPPPPGQ